MVRSSRWDGILSPASAAEPAAALAPAAPAPPAGAAAPPTSSGSAAAAAAPASGEAPASLAAPPPSSPVSRSRACLARSKRCSGMSAIVSYVGRFCCLPLSSSAFVFACLRSSTCLCVRLPVSPSRPSVLPVRPYSGPDMPPSLRTRQKWIAMNITITNGSSSTCSTYQRIRVSRPISTPPNSTKRTWSPKTGV